MELSIDASIGIPKLNSHHTHFVCISAALKAVKPVVFLAMLTTSVTGANHYIHFDSVKLNIGNAYNPNHGVFVATYNGTYQFTVTACSRNAHFVVLDFHVNDVVYDRLLAGDSVYDACNSKTIYVSLKENDDVYLKHEQSGDFLLANNGYGFPSFGGVLLKLE